MAKVVETAIDSETTDVVVGTKTTLLLPTTPLVAVVDPTIVTLETDEGVAAIVVEYSTLLEIAELVISLVETGT